MIQLTPHMRILLAAEPVDFRNGIDGLARVCREVFKRDPFSGIMFVFRNRAGTGIKLLVYDTQGFWLCHKRLSSGHLRWWPKGGESRVLALAVHELVLLLWNGDPSGGYVAPPWKPIAMPL